MRALLALAAALPLLLAGCSDGQAEDEGAEPGPVVQGWVVDASRVPVVGAAVLVQGTNLTLATDQEGHYRFEAPPAIDLLVTVAADGFVSESQIVPAFSGAQHVLNFSLERLPAADPYHVASTFDGIVSCGVTLVLQEDPDNPHTHQGLRCDTVLPGVTTNHVWNYTIPDNSTGLILEGFWEPQTPASQALVVKAEVAGTGQVLAFLETMSPLRIQLSAANLQQAAEDGRTHIVVTVTPGAGTGSHEHGAVGVFVDQPFTLVMTAFFNGPVDPSYVTPT